MWPPTISRIHNLLLSYCPSLTENNKFTHVPWKEVLWETKQITSWGTRGQKDKAVLGKVHLKKKNQSNYSETKQLLGCVEYYILVMQNSMTKDNVWLLEVSINVRAYKWIVEQFSKEAQTPSPCVLSTAISENSLRCRNVKCQGMKCDIPRKEAVERALTFNSQSRSRGNLLGILWMNITNKVPQWS